MNESCNSWIRAYGCNLNPATGCYCDSIITCNRSLINFQYENERSCRYAWNNVKAEWHQRCLKAKCDVVFHPNCPTDSKLVLADALSSPECCQKPGRCVCNEKYCADRPPKCPRDYEIAIVKVGSTKPGDCCPVYQCIPPPLDCSTSFCPSNDSPDCPSDSYRPDNTNLTLAGSERRCCPISEPCICKPDTCKPVMCPDGYHVEISKKGTGIPGSCCDVFECISVVSKKIACEHKDSFYEDGDAWRPDPCSECHCKGGLIFCKKYECPDTNWCSFVHVPENECCPVCIGCKSENGEFHNFTEQWQKDECTTCTCGPDGAILCHEQMCTVECENPVRVPGRCCPVCDKPTIVQVPFVCPSIELCPLMCEHGMKRDLQGCFTCECQESDWSHLALSNIDTIPIATNTTPSLPVHFSAAECPKFDEKSCPRKCIHGYEKDAKGCLACKCRICPSVGLCYKSCLYGFELNGNGCPICKCRGPEPFSVDVTLLHVRPKNKNCRTSSSIRDHGEWWFDGCRYCYCDSGLEFCSILACPPAIGCENPKYDENGCCKTCAENSTSSLQNRLVCHSPGTGRNYVEGEFWSLDKCTQCTCHIGHILCYRKNCGPLPCRYPKRLPERCCPFCDNDAGVNMTIVTFNPASVHCTLGAESYSSGSQWKMGACKSCRCLNGLIDCFEETCPQSCDQDRLLTIKNSCCPLCNTLATDKGVCRYKGISYSTGENWKDGHCRNCTCKGDNDVLCTQFECLKCPQGTNSTNSVPLPGQCCPMCPRLDNTFLYTLEDFNNPGAKEGIIYTNLAPMLILGAFSLLTLLLLAAFLISWYRKHSASRRRTISEFSTSLSSTKSCSDPLLNAIICGNHCPKKPSRKTSPLVDKISAFDVSSTSESRNSQQNSDRNDRNNNERNAKRHSSHLTSSPYDSDGASTALTYEGGTSS